MSPILIALVLFVVLGLAATAWLRRSPSLSSESQASERGAGQLGTLRWHHRGTAVLDREQRALAIALEDDVAAIGRDAIGRHAVLDHGAIAPPVHGLQHEAGEVAPAQRAQLTGTAFGGLRFGRQRRRAPQPGSGRQSEDNKHHQRDQDRGHKDKRNNMGRGL